MQGNDYDAYSQEIRGLSENEIVLKNIYPRENNLAGINRFYQS